MRIISGTARGRRLFSPGPKGKKGEIRPTSDRAREAIFNVLADKLHGAEILDLFAGTGALGLEALSRGGHSAFFVDNGRTALELIHKNIALCGFPDKSIVFKRDLSGGLFFLKNHAPQKGFSLVFIDPPYKKQLIEHLMHELANQDILSDNVLIVVECSARDQLPDEVSCFVLQDHRVYGEAAFRLYAKKRMLIRKRT